MKSTLSLLWERLDACKKEVIEFEKVTYQIRDALDTIPFAPRSHFYFGYHDLSLKATIRRGGMYSSNSSGNIT